MSIQCGQRSVCIPRSLRATCSLQATVAKLFTIELCYLATIAYHLYQLQTTPDLYAGSSTFLHASQLQARTAKQALPSNAVQQPLNSYRVHARHLHKLKALSGISSAHAGLQLPG